MAGLRDTSRSGAIAALLIATTACGEDQVTQFVGWPGAEDALTYILTLDPLGSAPEIDGPFTSAPETPLRSSDRPHLALSVPLSAVASAHPRIATEQARKSQLVVRAESCTGGRIEETSFAMPLPASTSYRAREVGSTEFVPVDPPEIHESLSLRIPLGASPCSAEPLQPFAPSWEATDFVPDLGPKLIGVTRYDDRHVLAITDDSAFFLEKGTAPTDDPSHRILPPGGAGNQSLKFRAVVLHGDRAWVTASTPNPAPRGVILELAVQPEGITLVETTTVVDLRINALAFSSREDTLVAAAERGIVLTKKTGEAMRKHQVESPNLTFLRAIATKDPALPPFFLGGHFNHLYAGRFSASGPELTKETPFGTDPSNQFEELISFTELRSPTGATVWGVTYRGGLVERDASGDWTMREFDLPPEAIECGSPDECGFIRNTRNEPQVLRASTDRLFLVNVECTAIIAYRPSDNCTEAIAWEQAGIERTRLITDIDLTPTTLTTAGHNTTILETPLPH